MKKCVAAVLVLTLIFSLAGCSGDSQKTCKAKAGVFWYNESDVYLGTVRDCLNRELDKANVKYKNYFAEGNQSKQIDQIKAAVEEGVSVLIVNQVTSGSLDTAENIMIIAGDLPVIFFNRSIGSDEDEDLSFFKKYPNACYIGTDGPEAGHMQGKMIGDYVLANFESIDMNGDGLISYAMFKGDEENVEAIFRTKYSVEDANLILTASGRPELQYFNDAKAEDARYQVDIDGTWSAQAAKRDMDKNLLHYNEDNDNMIELVICNNDDMAEGVVASLQSKGYNRADSHYIPVFGVDATAAAKALIANGSMTGTVKQDAEGMALAIRQTVDGIAAGKLPPEALERLTDGRFTIADNSPSKLYIAYASYIGE